MWARPAVWRCRSAADAGEAGMWLQAERLLRETSRSSWPDREPSTPHLSTPSGSTPSGVRRSYRSMEEVTEDELLAALRAHRWRIQRAAAALGISRGSLYDRIEKSQHIRKAADLSREEIEACQASCRGDLDAMVEALEVSKRGLQRRMTQLGLS